MAVTTINEKLEEAVRIKKQIQAAASTKDVDFPEDTPFADYPRIIAKIPGHLQKKTITPTAAGGVVSPDDGYDGFYNVELPAAPDLTPERIIKGASIFGVNGVVEVSSVIPRLHAPTISRNGDTINLSNPSTNGDFVTTHRLYNGASQIKEVSKSTSAFSLKSLSVGKYVLAAACYAEGFMESEASNTITASVFGITLNLTNLTSKNTDSVISDGLEWSTTLTPTSGKFLPEIVTVTMGGKSCKYEYDGYSGSLKIEKVTGDISVSAVALNAAKLHRPTVEIDGTLLTVIPPRFATETNVYIDDTLTWAYIDNSRWEVQEVSGAAKGFTLNANGYYESQCRGISNGYALCKVHLTLDSARSITFSCISYGESNYDYGIIGQPDKALSVSNSDDGATGSANVAHNFKGESSASVKNIVIEVDSGEHDIYVKYRKDSSGDNGNDSLQFTVSL